MTKYDVYLSGLNGYLRALERICGSAYSFGALAFSNESDLFEFISQKLGRGKSFPEMPFETLTSKLASKIFIGILSMEEESDRGPKKLLSKLILEDINEYYGLISISIKKDGAFHPLISGPVYADEFQTSDGYHVFAYWVKIENIFIFTYLRKKREHTKRSDS